MGCGWSGRTKEHDAKSSPIFVHLPGGEVEAISLSPSRRKSGCFGGRSREEESVTSPLLAAILSPTLEEDDSPSPIDSKVGGGASMLCSPSPMAGSPLGSPNGSNVAEDRMLPAPPLRPGEKEYLVEFQAALVEHEVPIPEDQWTLVRFLRARGQDGARDIDKSVAMIQKNMEWKQAYGVEDILNQPFQEAEAISTLYKVGFFNTTKEGNPVYIDRLGALDVDQLYAVANHDRLMQYHIALYEDMLLNKLPACSRAKGSRVVQIFSILDLEGCSTRSILDSKIRSFLGSIMSTDSDNYPEILYRMFIINAPSIFSMTWNAFSSFLDKNTVAKISILGSRYTNQLLEYIDGDKLPTFLGGSCECRDWPEVQPGPWQHYSPRRSLSLSATNAVPLHGDDAPVGEDESQVFQCQGGNTVRSAHIVKVCGVLKTSYLRRTACAVSAAGSVVDSVTLCSRRVCIADELLDQLAADC